MRTSVQRIAQIFGVVFILVALVGFLASGGSMEHDPTRAPRALGLFPVNLLHNLVHLAFGVWGVLASRSAGSARNYLVVSGGAYLALVLLGFLSPNTFGLMPIGGNDIWLHALLGIGMLAAGLSSRADVPGLDSTARV